MVKSDLDLRSLHLLAEHAEVIRALGKRAVQVIIEFGRRLIDAEGRCKAQGNWLAWLKREFGWSRQTADRFIEVAKASLKVPNLDTPNVPISGLYLLAAPSTPAEVIEVVMERSEKGETLTLAEVKTMIAEVEAKNNGSRFWLGTDRRRCAKLWHNCANLHRGPSPRSVAADSGAAAWVVSAWRRAMVGGSRPSRSISAFRARATSAARGRLERDGSATSAQRH